MKEFIKKYYKDLLLVVGYTGVAIAVYVVWFESMWHLWYVDFITAILILGLGALIGYFYMKSVVAEANKKVIKEEPKVEEATTEAEEVVEAKDGE